MVKETILNAFFSAACFTVLPSQYLKSPLERLNKQLSGHKITSHLLMNSKSISYVLLTLQNHETQDGNIRSVANHLVLLQLH